MHVLRFLVQWNVGRLEKTFCDNTSKNNIKLRKGYAENSVEKLV